MFLYILEGPDKGSFFPINRNSLHLGRAPSNDIRVTDDKVSSRHLLIEFKENTPPEEKKFYVKDMESTNGTFLNGYQIQETNIALREKLLIGNTLLMFCNDEDASQLKKGFDLSDAPSGNIIKKASSSKDTGVIIDRLEPSTATQQELALASKRLNGLYKLIRLFHSSFEGEQALLTRVLDCTMELISGDRCLAALYDEKSKNLIADSVQRVGNHGDLFSLSRTITREVIEQKTGILTLDAREDYRFKDGDSVWGLNIRSLMCSPIMFQDQVLGIINIDSHTSGNFNEEDLDLLNAIGREAGVALQNYRLYETTVRNEKLAAIGQTVASLSHCIKNILTGMKGGSHLVDIAIKNQDTPMLEKGWNIVKKSQNKISELVLDMLNFCRQTTLTFNLQEVNP
ncbi:MAG: FHA domain-containing protein, partial [Planctomycetota bacterium]